MVTSNKAWAPQRLPRQTQIQFWFAKHNELQGRAPTHSNTNQQRTLARITTTHAWYLSPYLVLLFSLLLQSCFLLGCIHATPSNVQVRGTLWTYWLRFELSNKHINVKYHCVKTRWIYNIAKSRGWCHNTSEDFVNGFIVLIKIKTQNAIFLLCILLVYLI